jgi:hypothetical protein
MDKYQVSQTHIINYLGGILLHLIIVASLLRPSMAGKASREKDLSIVPMGSTNSKFD